MQKECDFIINDFLSLKNEKCDKSLYIKNEG